MSRKHLRVNFVLGERLWGLFLLHYACSLHAFTSPEEVSYRLSDTDMYTLIKCSPKTRANNFRHYSYNTEMFLELSLNCHLFLHII